MWAPGAGEAPHTTASGAGGSKRTFCPSLPLWTTCSATARSPDHTSSGEASISTSVSTCFGIVWRAGELRAARERAEVHQQPNCRADTSVQYSVCLRVVLERRALVVFGMRAKEVQLPFMPVRIERLEWRRGIGRDTCAHG